MIFNYKAVDAQGNQREGSIDAVTMEVAIGSLQRRGLIISSITPTESQGLLAKNISLFERVSNREIVILSRQIATLFEAQVSALRVFRLLAAEAENLLLQRILTEVADDIQAGSSISRALGEHPQVFTPFYVNMVKSGEESGKLDSTFSFLADYMDRTYEVVSKARNALIYPAFVIATFVAVMALMLTLVIPKLSAIIKESGQEAPIYTKIVIGISDFLVNYGVFFLIAVAVGGVFIWRYIRTETGARAFDAFKLSVPYVGNLYEKLFFSRMADNLSTMLAAGISMVQAMETTAEVVGNRIYQEILLDATTSVKGGSSVSDALSAHPEMPGIMTQMIKVGEETGELGNILGTLAKFYRREVDNAVDTLVGMIEPAMIVLLGLGVGTLLAAVLIPIYNISTGI